MEMSLSLNLIYHQIKLNFATKLTQANLMLEIHWCIVFESAKYIITKELTLNDVINEI